MFKFSNKSGVGFTLLEVILAITVLTIAVSGVFILITQVLRASSVVQSKLIASYLAQEGIEIVKNIRDTNWLQYNDDWDNGLPIGDWQCDYTTTSFDDDCGKHYNCHFYDDNAFLKIEDTETHKFYNYSSGINTIFKRKITISKEVEQPDRLKVSVEVSWEDKGKIPPPIIVQAYLYNWRPQ